MRSLISFLSSALATAAFVLGSFIAFDARATSVLPLDLDQIFGKAEHVVHVRAIGNEVRPDPALGAVTVTTFAVLERVKGAGARTFTMRQAGGELDGVAFDFHVPQFDAGREYVVIVPGTSRLGLASPVGLEQGSFAVTAGPAGKEAGNGTDFTLLLSAADRAAATGTGAARRKAPALARGRIDLADFMTLLRAKTAKQ